MSNSRWHGIRISFIWHKHWVSLSYKGKSLHDAFYHAVSFAFSCRKSLGYDSLAIQVWERWSWEIWANTSSHQHFCWCGVVLYSNARWNSLSSFSNFLTVFTALSASSSPVGGRGYWSLMFQTYHNLFHGCWGSSVGISNSDFLGKIWLQIWPQSKTWLICFDNPGYQTVLWAWSLNFTILWWPWCFSVSMQ